MNIIFHIGAGKTGTSSIQGSLRNSDNILVSKGIKYLGLMLEHAPVKLYEWQVPSANHIFQSLSMDEAQEQVYEVITQSILHFDKTGIHTLVWSNEWFWGRYDVVTNPLKILEKSGHKVSVVAYVRRHDAWAKSAYSQWGIKHKTYKGGLIPFNEYVENRPVKFYGVVKQWLEQFGENFIIRNFDSANDVVDDFLDAVGIDKEGIVKKRVNESLGPEEMLVRAIFNNVRANDVMPVAFDRLFHTIKVDFKRDPVEWMKSLLPSDDDLEEVEKRSEYDLREINYILEKRGQEKLSFDIKKYNREFTINHDIAYSILFQLIERQAVQLQKLRKDFMDLKKSIHE